MSESTPDVNQPPAPLGVRLRYADGTVVECDVVRDPGFDRPAGHPQGEITYWRAVPRVRGEVPLGTYQVEFDAMPPRTGIWPDIPLAGPGLSSLMPGQ
jgi:hypothetical protein